MTLLLQAQVAPVEDAENNNWDTFDVPRRKRSGEVLCLLVSF